MRAKVLREFEHIEQEGRCHTLESLEGPSPSVHQSRQRVLCVLVFVAQETNWETP